MRGEVMTALVPDICWRKFRDDKLFIRPCACIGGLKGAGTQPALSGRLVVRAGWGFRHWDEFFDIDADGFANIVIALIIS